MVVVVSVVIVAAVGIAVLNVLLCPFSHWSVHALFAETLCLCRVLSLLGFRLAPQSPHYSVHFYFSRR